MSTTTSTTALESTVKSQQSSEQQMPELQLPLSLGYDILLSLVVPEPEVQDYNWNLEEARQSNTK